MLRIGLASPRGGSDAGGAARVRLSAYYRGFPWRVVVPSPCAVHADMNAKLLRQSLIRLLSVPTTPVGDLSQTWLWPAATNGHPQHLLDVGSSHPARQRPADTPAIEGALDSTLVEPCFRSTDVVDPGPALVIQLILRRILPQHLSRYLIGQVAPPSSLCSASPAWPRGSPNA